MNRDNCTPTNSCIGCINFPCEKIYPAVVKSFEKGFRESVKPTWIEWQKDVRRSIHNISSRRLE